MEKCLVLKTDVDLKSLPARLELTNIVTSLFKSRDLFVNSGGPVHTAYFCTVSIMAGIISIPELAFKTG